MTKMSEPKCTFTLTRASYNDIDDCPNKESLEPNGVGGDKLLGEYAESLPVDWLEPLDHFVVMLVNPCAQSQPLDGREGGTAFRIYTLSWLALQV